MKNQFLGLCFAIMLNFSSSVNLFSIDGKESTFITNLLAAYEASGKTVEIENQNEDEAIIINKKNGQRVLVDKSKEVIISSNFKEPF